MNNVPRICSAHELTVFLDRLKEKIASHPSSEMFAELETALEELKVAEETLYEQTHTLGKALERADTERRRYLELFEFAPDAYCATDARAVILEANRAMSELLHEPHANIVGKPLTVFVVREQRRELRHFVQKVLTAQSAALPPYPLVWQTEFWIRRGNPVPASARCAVSKSQGGNADGRNRLLWLLRDISQQKRAEEMLQRDRRELERAVEEKTGELRERLEELEAFHDVTVGRELRLMELERQVKSLQREAKSSKQGG